LDIVSIREDPTSSIFLALSRRPCEVASTDEVEVNVEDGLTGAWAYVEDRTITVFDVAIASELGGDQLHVSEKLGVFECRLVQSFEMALRNDENVGRCAGIDVFKGEDAIVFVNLLRRNLAFDDLAKETVHSISDVRFQIED
jgi:hypothetical protein